MKTANYFLVICILITGLVQGQTQTNLIKNGSFEETPYPFNHWSSVNKPLDLRAKIGQCTAKDGDRYLYIGDKYEKTGVYGVKGDVYQQVHIPENAKSCKVTFSYSVNTMETNAWSKDRVYIVLRDTLHNELAELLYIGNTHPSVMYGITTTGGTTKCATWVERTINIDPKYFGTDVRLCLEFLDWQPYPTIIRVDDVKMMVETCEFELSENIVEINYMKKDSYRAAEVTTNCDWTPKVMTGTSWLRITNGATQNGNGFIDIAADENTDIESRRGTIKAGEELITVIQGASYLGELEIEQENEVNIYPVPAGNDLNIDFETSIEGRMYRILDIQGNVRQNGVINEMHNVVHIGNLSNGVYFIQLEGAQNSIHRIVKQ